MSFFAVPYEIHFDDTMAYGSQHFMTNFRFQCAGREHLLFSDRMFREPAFRADFDRVILYTAEAYSRNLGPAYLGDRLAVLLSVEERTEVGLRFCFRTIREDGEPIAVGYQSMLCASRETGGVVAWPASFQRCFDGLSSLMEPPDEQGRGFRERVHLGGKSVRALFSSEIRALAATALTGPARVLEVPAAEPEGVSPQLPAGARVLLMGGQGTFDPERLASLLIASPSLRAEIAPVLLRAQQRLSAPPQALEGLLMGGEAAEAALAQHPDLDQLGIWLTGVLSARQAVEAGLDVHLIMGHSFGEIAALTAAGCLSLVDGAEVVCQRVLALRGCEGLGTLAAVGLSEADTAQILSELALPGVGIAGSNHPTQTVIAGPLESLEAVARALAERGKPATIVPSRYPFHSAALSPAKERFHQAIAAVSTRPPSIPVWSPIDGRLYTGAPGEIASALSGQLVRPFRFLDALVRARDAGAARFFDTTGGRIGRIVSKALGERAVVETPSEIEVKKTDAPISGDLIAIVSMGCLFPGGARDPEAYWEVIRSGAIGVCEDRSLEADFVARPLRADKALTTLAGRVDDRDLLAPEDSPGFAGFSRIQRLLAIAARQCRGGLSPRSRALDPSRVRVLLGSTADGSEELDNTLALESLGLGEESKRRLAGPLRARPGRSASLAPHAALQAVVREVFGEADVMLVDAACASSLYTTALGIAALRSGSADLVLAGGAFSPGPGNNCLFSQFRGLSTRAVRPFDVDADGVIFGEGAGLVALKRLSDAIADGDTVHAVIAGVGLSSDGKSSSANVPRAEGQRKAIERAWAGLDPLKVEYIEAHGTGTAAGDRTELEALQGFFGSLQRRVPIGSVKAQTGHLGWVAGTASLIKLCKMFAHDLIPRQHAFREPGPALVAADRFEALLQERPWPRGAAPRTAAASGFGFGGTDAHIVLWDRPAARAESGKATGGKLVVVGLSAIWPEGARATDAERALPSHIRLLPDIADDMDGSQHLLTKGAAEILAALGPAAGALRENTALVVALEGKTARGIEAVSRVLGDRILRLLREGGASQAALREAEEEIGKLRPSTPYTLQGMMPNVTPGRAAGLLDLQGPNLVVDAGASSLSAALRAATDLLSLGSALVIAGGVHAGAHVPQGDGRAQARDGLVLLALTTEEVAREHALEIYAELAFEGPQPLGDLSRHARLGAEGGRELLQAVREARSGHTSAASLPGARWSARSLSPSAPAPGPGFSRGSPVRYAAPRLVERPHPGAAALSAFAGLRVALLCEPEIGRAASLLLGGAGAVVQLQHPSSLDLPALEGHAPDLLLVVADLPRESLDEELRRATRDRALIDAAFLAMRALYGRIVSGQTAALALHVGGLLGRALHPATGLLAGMFKSVAREAVSGRVRVVSASQMPLEEALALACRELSVVERSIERCFDGQTRLVRLLQELPAEETLPAPPLTSESVVVVTGGARGVTAVLTEAMLRRYGCTAVLLGRTREGAAPPEILAASDAELEDLEQRFYRDEVARRPGVKVPELRSTFEGYRSARELSQTLSRLRAAGRVLYRAVDITSEAETAALTASVLRDLGRVDLVVHGAGLQTSKKLDRRKPEELRRNLDAKLLGLYNLYAALRAQDQAPPFHILTSAFSYFGNDGQADYGAANESLDRLCERFAGWSSVGWLAWDRIGMTKSPEYAVLGAARGLHGVSAEEGARLFLDVLEGRVRSPVQHQITDGEVAWYDLEVLPAAHKIVRPVSFGQGSVPVLDKHLVRGTPTVPGAWALDRMVASSGITAPVLLVEDLAFTRFVRVQPGSASELRLSLSEQDGRTVARLSGDIKHKSGAILQGDVDFSRATLRASGPLPQPALRVCSQGRPAEDPYCADGSPIALQGDFDCLRDIRIGEDGRSARFMGGDGALSQRVPALLLDAAWRLSAMHAEDGAIYAPVSFKRVSFTTDLRRASGELSLRATAPRIEGDHVLCDRVEAVDSSGQLVLSVEGGLARRIS